ncbi:(2,3-dihydroxybenzoyl)adenylate synthase BasE [Acinetobacter stercoris]|uniref:Enterobactin synthase component E n=1 Tax=Acinetobacter stercoris TaxID=2126983 RepID=A0A2U3MZN8_9GAMM|nr:(2,3-dihydroxybenzoyl)adenylate synthase BasE [Acinetobacter stercoris]SPL70887.1 Enterobactin synthase component E [Acinetobacter stercoris]
MKNLKIEFTPWPEERAKLYRSKGYWIDQPLTRILTTSTKSYPDSPAIICGERIFSYAELDRLSSNLASRLAEKGLGQGDTALVQLPNVAEFYMVFFALLKAGIAPLNALYSHRQYELNAFIKQIQPKLLIASRQHEVFSNDVFIHALDESGLNPEIILMLNHENNELALSEWLETPSDTSLNFFPTPADQVAFFQLSGGSTGTPKLIPRTHNDYDYSVRASAAICALTPDTRLLCAIPAPHNFMLSSPGALGVFHVGGCMVMAANPEPSNCFSIIQRHQVNMASLVPSAVIMWLQEAPQYLDQIQSLKLLQVGGASFPESLARQVPVILNCQLQQVFGMAEGLVNYTRLDDPDEQIFTTQGRPISPDDEIKIVDESGQEVAEGEVGMLATRGPYTFCGYYQSPEHNSQVFDQEGFYYSGDLVQRTADGNLHVAGRIKDQINRGGEKIASEEIEELILLHPDVIHTALVAIGDEQFGEKSCAFIVSRSTELKAITLRRHLMKLGIAQYKLPDQIRLIESLPLTAVGKVDKKQLRSILNTSKTS